MKKSRYEFYEISNLLGDIEDPELEYYLLSKQKLPDGINFLFNINDIEFNHDLKIGELLSRFFHFISDVGKSTPKYLRLRNNLEKFPIYADEVYKITLFFEDQEIFSGQLDELLWVALQDKPLWAGRGWSWPLKYKLRFGFFRVHLQLLSPTGETRAWQENEDRILDTDAYVKSLFFHRISQIWEHKIKESKQYYGYQNFINIINERKKLWGTDIDVLNPKSVPFNLMGADDTITYWELLSLFWDLKYNHRLLEKSKQAGKYYRNLIKGYFQGLNSNQMVVLKINSYKHPKTNSEKIKLWLKIFFS